MTDIRWKQRFQNFERAFNLLKEALEPGIEHLSNLEKEGVIHRFEYTFELAWKTLKDYLEFKGILVKFTRDVIKEAFASGVIEDGESWIEMLDDRNTTSHEYDEEKINLIVKKIDEIYFVAIKQVYNYLKGQLNE